MRIRTNIEMDPTERSVSERTSVIGAVVLMAILSFGMLTGCDDQGPAEEAGESVDESMRDAREGLDDAGDEAEDRLSD